MIGSAMRRLSDRPKTASVPCSEHQRNHTAYPNELHVRRRWLRSVDYGDGVTSPYGVRFRDDPYAALCKR